MSKKNNSLQRKLKFHCSQCETLYQLMELHSQSKPNCSENCRTKWQDLCHEYYQEKVLGYIQQQEQEAELEENSEDNLAQQLTKAIRRGK